MPTTRYRCRLARSGALVVLTVAAALGSALRPVLGSPTARRVTPNDDLLLEGGDAFVWDARAARHLLNRAGFGARPDEVERAVALGQEACVDELLAGRVTWYEPFYVSVERPTKEALAGTDKEARRKQLEGFRRRDREQMSSFGAWWIERMLLADHPLRERMTLFWHGYFTSSIKDVKSSAWMIAQNELFRLHGLASFEELLRAVLRDPALLVYLDSVRNSQKHPNENLARELMELFTLGEGNYTERDVTEAARALTGWRKAGRSVRFRKSVHDDGEKTILGRTAAFGVDELVDVLLAQDAAPRWLAGRLLEYFEGVEPDAPRREHYADLLRANGWRIDSFLRALFLDPAFYRDDVIGQRVASPIDYLVGNLRRLDAAIPAELVLQSASLLGQSLFAPPNVKGWDEGLAWLSTATLQQRGNLMGLVLGAIELADLSDGDAGDASGAPTGARDAPARTTREALRPALRTFGRELGKLRSLSGRKWTQSINLGARLARRGARRDGAMATALFDELLPVEPSRAAERALRAFLRQEREALGYSNGDLLRHRRGAEDVLRRAAHVLFSLPEAQLL